MSTQRFTVGQIAQIASERKGRNIPVHRILYMIRARNIAPVEKAARFRLFDEAAIDRIVDALA